MNPRDVTIYPSFVRQSHNLRIAAAAAFRLEKKPPRSNPPEFWDPYIYTFSTGDFLTGGTKLHPHIVACPNNQLQGTGNEENAFMGAIPGRPDTEIPCDGYIYKYEGANFVSSYKVPANSQYDIINDDF